MSELFSDSEVDSPSPKLVWLKKHKLNVTLDKDRWCCRNNGYTRLACGDTEEEAIINYCERYEVKHWSLE